MTGGLRPLGQDYASDQLIYTPMSGLDRLVYGNKKMPLLKVKKESGHKQKHMIDAYQGHQRNASHINNGDKIIHSSSRRNSSQSSIEHINLSNQLKTQLNIESQQNQLHYQNVCISNEDPSTPNRTLIGQIQQQKHAKTTVML